MKNINEMTTSELVTFYNGYATEMGEKNVNRFSTKAAGIRRCEEMLERFEAFQDEQIAQLAAGNTTPEMDAEDQWLTDAYGMTHCPSCGIHLGNGVDEGICLGCGEYLNPGEHANRSAGVAKSWEDEEVRAKRAQRHHVVVDSVEYRSVKQAFEALELPLKEHIKFRMALKAAGKPVKAYDRTWKVIEV